MTFIPVADVSVELKALNAENFERFYPLARTIRAMGIMSLAVQAVSRNDQLLIS